MDNARSPQPPHGSEGQLGHLLRTSLPSLIGSGADARCEGDHSQYYFLNCNWLLDRQHGFWMAKRLLVPSTAFGAPRLLGGAAQLFGHPCFWVPSTAFGAPRPLGGAARPLGGAAL